MEAVLNLLKFNILSFTEKKLISNMKVSYSEPPVGEWQSWDEELKEQRMGADFGPSMQGKGLLVVEVSGLAFAPDPRGKAGKPESEITERSVGWSLFPVPGWKLLKPL